MRLGDKHPQSDYEHLFATILDIFAVDYYCQMVFHDTDLTHLDVSAFYVDFVLARRDIVVEIDGPQHRGWRQARKDRMRDEFLRSRGFIIVRVRNKELDDDLEAVATRIYRMTIGQE